MRRVNRSDTAVPSSLAAAKTRELKRYKEHRAKPAPKKAFTFRAYKSDEVRHSLEALFHGKCAYCESRYDVTAPVDVEHFRPKGPAKDGSHEGYWWLAAVWTNLLPSCIDCNRRRNQPTPVAHASLTMLLADAGTSGLVRQLMTGKESCFPVGGPRLTTEPVSEREDAQLTAEAPLLLDPCADDPSDHLAFHIDRREPVGLVYARGTGGAAAYLPAAHSDPAAVERAAVAAGVSTRGAVSIQVYGLNRLRLVQERTRVLRQLEFMAALIVDLSDTADRLEGLAVSPRDEAIRNEAVQRLKATVGRLLAQINSMAEPAASFTTMVAAWIDAFTTSRT